MNNFTWIGIIAWGLLVAAFGLYSAGPASMGGISAVQAQDAFFLIFGGLISCGMGAAGLLGMTKQGASVAKRTK